MIKFKSLLERLLLTQSSALNNVSMAVLLTEILREHKIPYTVDPTGNITARKGTLSEGEYYPTLVAHYDTVHDIVDDYTVHRYRDKETRLCYTSPTGIGGDDKVGLAIGLWLLINKPTLKAVFTVGEESGCFGVDGLLEPEAQFADSGYLIEPDRRGSTDRILSYMGQQTASDAFCEIVRSCSPNYHDAEGLITDIFAIRELGIELSAMNLSCGYYKPHLSTEYIRYGEVKRALTVVSDIIDKAGLNRYEHPTSNQTTLENQTTLDIFDEIGWENTLPQLYNTLDEYIEELVFLTGINDETLFAQLGAHLAWKQNTLPQDFIESIYEDLFNYMNQGER